MKISTTLLATSAALLLSQGVIAADTGTVLTNVQMPVMVNQTGAYVDAQKNMRVDAGDRLMVMGGGSAQIQYANGCVQTVEANEILQVGTPESCSAIDAASINNQMGATGTSGGGTTTGVLGTNLGAGTLAVTAAAAVGVVVTGADMDGDGNSLRPISR